MRWQLNADALYRFGAPRAVLQPYLGAGLGILRGSGNRGTDAGMNAIGGALLALGPVRPFAQARLTVTGPARFSLSGGVLLMTW